MEDIFPEKLISIIYRAHMSRLERKLKSYGIGSGQFLFLISLYCKDGVNQDELSLDLGVDKTTTTRALNKLEQDGFIYREQDEHDKRYKRVYVTDKAKNIKYEIQNLSEEWNEKLFEGFSLNEKQTIINALTKMIENTKKIV